MDMFTFDLFTSDLYRTPEPDYSCKGVTISGTNIFGEHMEKLPLGDMHLIVSGTPAAGKTTFLLNIARQTVRDRNSVHLFHDVKTDFCRELCRPGEDVVISLYDKPDTGTQPRWNLMAEVISSEHPRAALKDICRTLFEEEIKNSPHPFFPQAASLVLEWVLNDMLGKCRGSLPTNRQLINYVRTVSLDKLAEQSKRLRENGRLSEACAGNGDLARLLCSDAPQTRGGIISNLETVLGSAFLPGGNFCADGYFSVCSFIKNAKGKRLFFVYDPSQPYSSGIPIGIMINLAAKTMISLAENGAPHKTYAYLDEAPRLPCNVNMLETLVSLGRTYGARVLLGVQSIAQMQERYGEEGTNALLASFTNSVIMSSGDPLTIKTFSERSGATHRSVTAMGTSRASITSAVVDDFVIPAEVLADLKTGQAVVCPQNIAPYWIKLDEVMT